MKDTEVKILLEELFGLYPSAPSPSRRLREAWTPALANVSVPDAREAVLALSRSKTFLPSLAEVLEMCEIVGRERRRREPVVRPFVDYSHHIGVRAPCDDELEADRWNEAAEMRGKMVGKDR